MAHAPHYGLAGIGPTLARYKPAKAVVGSHRAGVSPEPYMAGCGFFSRVGTDLDPALAWHWANVTPIGSNRSGSYKYK